MHDWRGNRTRAPATRGASLREAGWLIAGGLALALVGWLPLQLEIWFGPRDANPIGLGLLRIVAVPSGLILAGFGLLRLVIAWLVAPRP
ncbi:MAG: hypothetical protein IT477_05075 [Rhodanobacteraceae bacterium]|nr:hypothetical protein [Rhodanobacteraceae bacterium]